MLLHYFLYNCFLQYLLARPTQHSFILDQTLPPLSPSLLSLYLEFSKLAQESPNPYAKDYLWQWMQLHENNGEQIREFFNEGQLDYSNETGLFIQMSNGFDEQGPSSFPIPVTQERVSELQMYAGLAASTYCMRQNIFPRFKCGYPRCRSSKYGLEEELLEYTTPVRYVTSPNSKMVGLVALNDEISKMNSPDLHLLTPKQKMKRKSVLIPFRGSLVPQNFIYDLKLFKIKVPDLPDAPADAEVHSGFYEIWRDVEPSVNLGIIEAVERLLQIEQEEIWLDFVLTGHSLGGVQSVLAALYLENDYSQRQGIFASDRFPHDRIKHCSFRVYTFGQPRIGNSIFAKYIMQQESKIPITRVTFYNDLIPHMPPFFSMGLQGDLPWWHHAREVFVNRIKETVYCDNGEEGQRNGEDSLCSLGVKYLNILSHLTYWHILFGPWC